MPMCRAAPDSPVTAPSGRYASTKLPPRNIFSLVQGRVSEVVRSRINAEVPGCPWLSGYCAILAGAVLTFILQEHMYTSQFVNY